MSAAKKMMMAVEAGLDPRLLFSTSLYAGNNTNRTITNGLDLAGEGGLVWIKNRTFASTSHYLFDTLRGTGRFVASNNANAQATDSLSLTSFGASGFNLGTSSSTNSNTHLFAAWAFRRSAKFLDVVSYTGNGLAGRQIPHSLGVVPGLIMVKRLNSNGSWRVQHRSLDASTQYLALESTGAALSSSTVWGAPAVDSYFTVGSASEVNASGGEYVAYLFAHDPNQDGVISCGSYLGNNTTSGPIIDLGWRPQYVLIKNATTAADWLVFDTARGIVTDGNDPYLRPNSDAIEATAQMLDLTATGFQPRAGFVNINNGGSTYIYMAIRAPE